MSVILHKAYKQLSLIILLLLCLLGISAPVYAEVGVPAGKEFIPSSKFNPNLAIFAERVASDIYNPNGTHDKWLKHNGFTTTNLIQYGSATTSPALRTMQAVVAHKQITTTAGSRNLYVIAFRGSENAGSQAAFDWGINFRSLGMPVNLLNPPLTVSVHMGFEEATMSMLNKERSVCVPQNTVCTSFQSVILNGINSSDIFLVIGHSLGGAMASRYAATLLERGVPVSNIMAYTFGAPAIGDSAYVQRYDSTVGRHIHRVRNLPDPVPFAAFAWQHIGQEHCFSGSQLLTSAQCKNSQITTDIGTLFSLSIMDYTAVGDRFSAHKMVNYLKNLEAYNSIQNSRKTFPTFKSFLATASAEEINRYLYLLSLKGQLLDTSTTKIKLERIDTSVKFVNAAFDIAGWFSHVGNIKKIPNPGKMLNLARRFGKSEETVRAIMVLSVMADSMTMGFPQYSSTEKIASKSVLQKFADLTNATAVNAALNSYAGQTLLYVVSKTLSFALDGQGPNAIGRLLASPKKFAAIFKVGLKASKGISPMNYAADITKIVINIGAATWVTSITNSMNTTLIATEFLDQYLRTYKGDLTAMMAGMGVSIGYGQYGVNDLASVFKTYTRQKNALGTSLREMYGRQDLIDAVLGGGYDEQAAITLVRDILLQHAPLTFRILTPPAGIVLGRKNNVQPGQTLQRTVALDPLLILDGYSVNSLNVKHVGINNFATPLAATTSAFSVAVNPDYPSAAQYYYKVVATLKAPVTGAVVNVGLDSTILPAFYITDYNAYCKAAQVTIGNLTAASFSLDSSNQLTLGLQVPANYISCFNSTIALGDSLNLQARIKSIAPWGETSILSDWKSALLVNGSYQLSLTFPVKNHNALLDKTGSLGDYQLELEVGHGELETTTLRTQNLLLNYAGLGTLPALGAPYLELVVADAGLSSVNATTGQTQIQAAASEQISLVLHNQTQFTTGDTLSIALQDQNGAVLNLTGTLAADGSVTVTIANAGTYTLQSVGNAVGGYVVASSGQPVLVRTIAQAVASGSMVCPPGKYCIGSPPSYTKLDANGHDLADTATQWSCVRDNRTNLVWEVKTKDGGLHDASWTYSWYSSDSTINGGFSGAANGGVCDNKKGCDTESYVVRTNLVGLCGNNYEWRMPRVEELATLIDYNRANPAINNIFFPNTNVNYYYTTSSRADYRNTVLIAMFGEGNVSYTGKGGVASPVRLIGVAKSANMSPSANAGIDQRIVEQGVVTLNGSGTDADGTISNYQWVQTNGRGVALIRSATPSASFTLPSVTFDETFTFRLTVTDNNGAKAFDTVIITAANIPIYSYRYTKIDNLGNDLPDTALNWSCVRDDTTGLTWEVKTADGGLRDRGKTYGYVQRVDYANAVNNSGGICGATGWRIPTINELKSLIYCSDSRFPAFPSASCPSLPPGISIVADYFPNTVGSGYYTSTWNVDAYWHSTGYMYVFFYDGNISTQGFDYPRYMRLVR